MHSHLYIFHKCIFPLLLPEIVIQSLQKNCRLLNLLKSEIVLLHCHSVVINFILSEQPERPDFKVKCNLSSNCVSIIMQTSIFSENIEQAERARGRGGVGERERERQIGTSIGRAHLAVMKGI